MRGIVRRLGYKPGWEFLLECLAGPYGTLAIVITYTAPDSRNPGRETTVSARYLVPECFQDAAAFFSWLRATAIVQTEFLRYDGTLVRDPHDPDAERRPGNPFLKGRE
jgi:hypothetical protein